MQTATDYSWEHSFAESFLGGRWRTQTRRGGYQWNHHQVASIASITPYGIYRTLSSSSHAIDIRRHHPLSNSLMTYPSSLHLTLFPLLFSHPILSPLLSPYPLSSHLPLSPLLLCHIIPFPLLAPYYRPGLINVDFADVRTIMGDAGTALMGIGRGSGNGPSLSPLSSHLMSLNMTWYHVMNWRVTD